MGMNGRMSSRRSGGRGVRLWGGRWSDILDAWVGDVGGEWVMGRGCKVMMVLSEATRQTITT